jgi:hypothetical protein
VITWLVIGLMFLGVLAALGYPLVRAKPNAGPLPVAGSRDDADALIERAVAARRKAAAGRGGVAAVEGTCPQCQKPARAGDLFCRGCGATLGRRCPACGAAYDEEDRFCVQCGTALPSGRGE